MSTQQPQMYQLTRLNKSTQREVVKAVSTQPKSLLTLFSKLYPTLSVQDKIKHEVLTMADNKVQSVCIVDAGSSSEFWIETSNVEVVE